jgi:hypothetical protein
VHLCRKAPELSSGAFLRVAKEELELEPQCALQDAGRTVCAETVSDSSGDDSELSIGNVRTRRVLIIQRIHRRWIEAWMVEDVEGICAELQIYLVFISGKAFDSYRLVIWIGLSSA